MLSAMAWASPSSLLSNLADKLLLLNFLIIAVAAPLLDAQTCLPSHWFPPPLVRLHLWYAAGYGDYLALEKPGFFKGAVLWELLFQWPLAVANVYGLARGSSWYPATCLMYGASTCSAMAAVLGEMVMSGRASGKLLAMYLPFFVFSLVAIVRGLLPSDAAASKQEKSFGKKMN